MREETRILTYRKFTELSSQQQQEKIKNANLDSFYENISFWYDDSINEIFSEIDKEDFLLGDKDKLSWQSSSQGWYFSSCQNYLTGTGDISCGIYSMNLSDIVFTGYNEFNKNFVIRYANFFKNNEPIEFIDIKNAYVRSFFESFALKLSKKASEFNERIKSTILTYDMYYPTDEEISEFFIENQTEFLISQRIIS